MATGAGSLRCVGSNSCKGSFMAITITLPPSVPRDAQARVEALVFMLGESDPNFVAVPIEIVRSDTSRSVVVLDEEDYLRGELLAHLIEESLRDGSESIMGELH